MYIKPKYIKNAKLRYLLTKGKILSYTFQKMKANCYDFMLFFKFYLSK